ncbi:fumarylacetoacetate hydrolase family protein [Bacteriovorax sp. PP10]|uniref:Fumarylacetoacetate hydrolase family protein n=1 Tax=Bacteriovorax antarcticus TaxID=3088717 RepID=A0ABU5VPP4_9BACT|nr:fumarylacetoacetate hydrolase family protein [Bacteriovorax sp. PP10]MEA9355016.1 fumarylacetoacetate hydrolase family protein [Bacteriovorax sp. PP10]
MAQKKIPGTDLNVQNIFCIGRNYVEHAKELNNPVPASPVVFTKPTSSICYDGENLIIPAQSQRVDHEVEIVVVIGKTGKNIPESSAVDYISHIGIGLDFTARDLQDKAKEKSLPWSIAKGFDTFAAISSFVPFKGDAETLKNLTFQLEVNGEIRQKGDAKNMIFPIPTIVSYLSSIFTLTEGDLIFTGTPEGVGIVKAGEILKATLTNGPTLSLGVQNA